MSRRIEFTTRAKQDLREIRDWIAARSRDGAVRWLEALDSACDKLVANAESAVSAAEAEDLGIDLHQQLFKTRRGRPYRMLFLVQDERVVIVAIRGPGQDLANIDDVEIPS